MPTAKHALKGPKQTELQLQWGLVTGKMPKNESLFFQNARLLGATSRRGTTSNSFLWRAGRCPGL